MDVLEFAKIIGNLKRIKRSGWIRENIKDLESVSDHSFRVAILSMVLAPELRVNSEKLVKMALIHEIGETKLGDIVWARGEDLNMPARKKKEKEELKIAEEIFAQFKNGNEYKSLFEEIIERKTEESKILWQLDKLETAIQALEYEESDGKDLSEFFDNADIYIKHPILKEILVKIKLLRKLK